ncbi:flagellar basal body-associated FliL family protein [Luteimonas sp. FCS-9]|uniref:flagellar basal body-associated FliL family protein n=1 Tax=Luteimonas sp. FCS-9 TaxID=1547516 RepID=UPI00063E79CC|nr:flagellar basal body-associated FliL family protein [Luteimonas sp. FCS-9]KLJ02751.1 hypothetical protein WQ56_00185 [Luteimonas sp. FCS-9]
MAAAADPQRKSPSKKRLKPLLLILGGLLLLALAAAGGAAALHLRGEPGPAKPALPAQAQYLPMAPPFVVNLGDDNDGPRYLQVEVQLVTRDPLDVAQLQHHEPALRARLLMLFSQQTAGTVATREGKEALRAQALREVQTLMTEETGKPSAESLLFTSFVTQ